MSSQSLSFSAQKLQPTIREMNFCKKKKPRARTMQIVVQPTEALPQALGQVIANASKEAIAARGKFVTAWSGGSLPKIVAPGLVGRTDIEFDKWHIFFADERFVALDHADSNYALLKKELLGAVPVPAGQVYPIDPNATNVEACAVDYQNQVCCVTFFACEAQSFARFCESLGDDQSCELLKFEHQNLTKISRFLTTRSFCFTDCSSVGCLASF
jgi:6-phosphogluconolactonase